MTLDPRENMPSSGEINSPAALSAACEQLANESYKFRVGELTQTQSSFTSVDRADTTYSHSFHAEYSEAEGGNVYTLELGATHELEEAPDELVALVREEGAEISDVDYGAGIEVEYDLTLVLMPDGRLLWDERRGYDLWSERADEAAAVVDSGNDGKPVSFERVIASNMSDEADMTPEAEAKLSDEDRMHLAIEKMLSETAFGALLQEEYFGKAYSLFAKLLAGRDADFNPADYFPVDVVRQIIE